MKKIFSSDTKLVRSFGNQLARVIKARIESITMANSLADVLVDHRARLHPLSGKRKGQYAVDLTTNVRLVFEPNHDPVPQTADGAVDLTQVVAITILEVVDYH